jgi:hypothetical protein
MRVGERMNRRIFLRGAGAVTFLIAGGGAWYSYEEGAFSLGKGPAFAPWNDWNKPRTGTLALVRAAILAASPHNTQPWLFRVNGNEIQLFSDRTRNTGALDPFLRELHVGLGCAVENMCVAAPTAGYSVTVESVEDTLQLHRGSEHPQLVATLRCVPASLPPDPLYEALPERHTNRLPYRQQALPSSFQTALLALPQSLPRTKLFLFTSRPERQGVAELVSQSDKTVYADKAVTQGTAPWERVFHWKDVERYRDGITLQGYGATSAMARVLYCLPDSAEKAVMAKSAGDSYPSVLNASALFGLIAVRDRYAIDQCLQAGRLWERAHLLATANRIAARPINEAIELLDIENSQERTRTTEAKLNALTNDPDWQPTFMFRMGYARRPGAASPRRDLLQVLA